MAATFQSEALYSADEVAERIGRSRATMEKWRRIGSGPDFIKPCGARGAVLYRGADVLRWLDSRVVRVGATPETAAA